MADSRCNVVFTGNLAEGKVFDVVIQALAGAFRTEPAKMEAIFRGSGSVVRRDVDRATAEKYRDYIERLGAICVVEEIGAPPVGEEATAGKDKEPAQGSASGTRVVEIRPMNAKLQFSPLRVNRLSGWEDGIDLNRSERGRVSFGDILALSTVKLAKASTGQTILILFVREGKRPYVIDANLIAFAEFPDVKDASTDTSLRNLLVHMFSKNPAILCDTVTAEFVGAGGKVATVSDLVAQTTAVAEALRLAEEGGQGPAGEAN